MKVILLVLLLGCAVVPELAGCPSSAPGGVGFSLPCTICPNGPLTFTLQPAPSGFFPPAIFDPGYILQPCDVATWDFGDGTPPVTLVGAAQATHDFVTPGNFLVSVTIKNALGSVTASGTVLAATSPTLIFGDEQFVTVGETAGSAVVRIDRGLDLSRTVTVTMVIYSGEISPAVSAASYTLTFAPNETQKSITIPIHDDDLFEDTRNYPLHFTAFSGGAYSDEFPYGTTTIRVLDDEPRPTLTVGNARVFEGDVGFTPVYLPLQLSGPLGTDIYVYGEPHGLTASADDFLPSNEANTAVIRAGQTTGQLPIYIVADQRPEPDEQFLVYLESDSSSRTALFGPPAVVTILNDDYPATATSKHRAAGH